MKRVAFATLGCKTNQYETDALIDIFHKHGDLVVDFDEAADVYIVNTCTVTQVSDKKSRQMIRRAKKHNPDAITVVMGCYAQISTDEVAALEGVDIVLGTNERGKILSYIDDVMTGQVAKPLIVVEDIGAVQFFEELSISDVHAHTRAFIKIQEGCNQFCSYCIIPYARGRVRSRALASVVKEVETLVSKGYIECVLTGIHIGSYGVDLEGNLSLIDLIEALHAIDGLERIRLGSLEPTLIDDGFIQKLRKLPKVCDHFHLSLQSGSNGILKRMNRKYSREDFLAAVERLKDLYDKPAITTDIIVGFPGETDADFEDTKALVEAVSFSEIHVFPFSPRQGTPAARMTEIVSPAIKKARSEALIAFGKEKSDAYVEQFLNQSLEIILEERKEGQWLGHAKNYLKVYVEGEASTLNTLVAGQKIMVTVLRNAQHHVFGKII